jgi:hypothetical protein
VQTALIRKPTQSNSSKKPEPSNINGKNAKTQKVYNINCAKYTSLRVYDMDATMKNNIEAFSINTLSPGNFNPTRSSKSFHY